MNNFLAFQDGNGLFGKRYRVRGLHFHRSADIDHNLFSKSISAQVAPRTSPDRVAVKMVNRIAAFVAGWMSAAVRKYLTVRRISMTNSVG